MKLFQYLRTTLIALSLVLVLTVSTACSSTQQATAPSTPVLGYTQLERGNSSAGQDFGEWVIKASQGLVQDAYVRDNDKLGVIISSQVRPNEVRNLAKSLAQGFQKNFPNRDLNVLVYAPDKKLILTAKYDNSRQEIKYQ
ncbi:hypothetical protein [Merismopedia glauca]|uniref:Uncharacterized protein n=1 Tax=Merismopedia glauca CCAP 1448/3 TaxID=1296344 RepID=A0A2T1C2J0_9CYAN|nr:hypothetical protein [Merismopedia glauca]PSB02495.1 hypothetical protein C7B64_12915 [Merismopedia glauca CCAP 1448/3]